jgi:hypothetical protein
MTRAYRARLATEIIRRAHQARASIQLARTTTRQENLLDAAKDLRAITDLAAALIPPRKPRRTPKPPEAP